MQEATNLKRPETTFENSRLDGQNSEDPYHLVTAGIF